MRLLSDETAVQTKKIPVESEMRFHTWHGEFSVRSSQHATEGGRLIETFADGALYRKRGRKGYIWIYRDDMPGSTDFYGPAVDHRKLSPALRRIGFETPRLAPDSPDYAFFVGDERCLDGVSSSSTDS